MFNEARAQLLAAYAKVIEKTPPDTLEQRRQNFLAAFPPEAVCTTSGPALLELVHGAGPRQGLFYELEFGELGKGFGSVAGHATKFKVFRGGKDGRWRRAKGSLPVRCTEAEAIQLTETLMGQVGFALQRARDLRLDQGDQTQWMTFETEMAGLASVGIDGGTGGPTLGLGWAHKYLALVRPELFSFHHQTYQLSRHLVRLGEEPLRGRYLVDWQWRGLRLGDPQLSELHPAALMVAAYSEDGFGYGANFWRVGTVIGADGVGESRWPAMRDGSFIGIGWCELGDLSVELEGLSGDAAICRIKELLEPNGYNAGRGNSASQIYAFVKEMKPGDRVAAMQGGRLQGVGIISGGYEHRPGPDLVHRRQVQWFAQPDTRWEDFPGRLKTINNFVDRYSKALYIERFIQAESVVPAPVLPPPPPSPPPLPLTELEARVQAVLKRKGQVILYGPPGTGKTYNARRTARELLTRNLFAGLTWARLNEAQQREVDARITFCTFHPAYGYEEFIEGYRPSIVSGTPTFALEDGLFLRACKQARQDPEHHEVLIIDEINRGNVAAVLGELITLLEKDKRESLTLQLPLSRRAFTVPENLWIIGTMNTADRSISLLDVALRRRFGFIELLPQTEHLDAWVDELHLGTLLATLNQGVREHVLRNARELQVGHAYLMSGGEAIQSKTELLHAMRDDVIPLLAEYCFENFSALEQILGEAVVDSVRQLIRDEVIQDPHRMYEALVAVCGTALATTDETLSATDENEEGPGESFEETLA